MRRPYLASSTSALDFLEFACTHIRFEFIRQFNQILGDPNVALRDLQTEFIMGEMSASATIDFVKVCRGIISDTAVVINSTGNL